MLVSHKGSPLSIDDADRLWLSRAVEAEGQPRAHVAQTLVNRWAWLLDKGETAYPRLQDLVRAYAQPVNPRWFPGGDLYQAQIDRLLPNERAVIPALHEAAVRRVKHAERTTFSPQTLAAVEMALKGPIVIAPGTVHFSVPRESAEWRALLTRAPMNDRENAFYRASDSHGALYAFETGGPRVWTLASALETQSPIAGVVVAAIGLMGAFAWSRKRRR